MPPKPEAAHPRTDWKAAAERQRAALTPERMAELETATGVPASAWSLLSPGWCDAAELKLIRAGGAGWTESPPSGAWSFAEHAGNGQVVGLSLRATDGRKGSPAGAGRGLVFPSDLHQRPGVVLVVEGASDVAAATAMGLAAVGRPSNRAGAEDLTVLLDGRPTVVVGERDGKPDGSWPGRDGAKAVAQRLAARWAEPVKWSLPPVGVKDVREFFKKKIAGGLIADDTDAMEIAGAEFRAELAAAAREARPEKRTQADALVDMARQIFRLGISTDGESFAVPNDGPAVAIPLRGSGSGLRAKLAKISRERTGKTPAAAALADAMLALEGMAGDAEREKLGLRVAEHGDAVVLDLGDASGRAVVVGPGGWAIEAVSPVLFRRTALTGAIIEPERVEPGGLLELRSLLNVDGESWPLVVGWLVAAVMPGVPHPPLFLSGEQGTGKSTAAGRILGITDPSPAPLRSEPRDVDQWAVAAAGSWAFCLDNISSISGWLSDALCKAVTGDGLVRRKLYSDSDVAILSFKRCVILTSIDAGALRGDLADRLLVADLVRIPDDQRRTEADLHSAYDAARPRLLGALLSAVARVLAALPGVKLEAMPRMADFARVLASLDSSCPELTGGRALELFAGQRRRIADDVIESDPVAVAVVRIMESRTEWTGTAGVLLHELTASPAPRGWPKTGRALVGRLRRLRPALTAIGINHTGPGPTDKARIHRIERAGIRPPIPPIPPESAVAHPSGGIPVGRSAGGSDSPPPTPPNDRPAKTGPLSVKNGIAGGSGGLGGEFPGLSEFDPDADFGPGVDPAADPSGYGRRWCRQSFCRPM